MIEEKMAEGLSPVSFNEPRGPCAVCCKPDGLPCSWCRVDYYCGKEHQTAHWPRHKAGCGALAVRSDAVLGRHVVAVKDVPKGTVVMRETPLIAFPRFALDPGQMLCVSCYHAMPGGPTAWAQCSACGSPVCDARCADKPVHRAECLAFQRAGYRVRKGLQEVDTDWMNALGALRTCLATPDVPQLKLLQSAIPAIGVTGKTTDSSRRSSSSSEDALSFQLLILTSQRRHVFEKTVSWLRARGVTWIPDEDLLRAVAANQINAFCEDATSAAGPDSDATTGFARGSLYAGVCLLEHCCTPNTHLLLEDVTKGVRLLMVSRDVKKGDHLSVDYQDNPFRGTAERRRANCQRGFICRCALCEDPTEMGLHLGSPCCMKCAGQKKKSFVINGKCATCGQPGGSAAMSEAMNEFRRLEQAGDPRLWLRFPDRELLWPRGPLHDTHQMVLSAKMEVVDALERSQLGWQDIDFDNDDLDKCETLCLEVLAALEVLRPGVNSYRQSALIALYQAIGLRLFSVLLKKKGRVTKSQWPTGRQMALIIKELETMMIAGQPKMVLAKIKHNCEGILSLPEGDFEDYLAPKRLLSKYLGTSHGASRH